MKSKYIFLFAILVLGIFLSTFLGSYHPSSDSGIYYEGFTNLLNSNVFYGEPGEMIIINSITDAGLTATFSKDGNEITMTFPPYSRDSNNNTFTAPDGFLITLNTVSNENQTLVISNINIPNMKFILTQDKPNTSGSTSSYGSSFIADLMSNNNTNTNTNNNTNTMLPNTSSYDNYNHYMGTSYPNKFYGPNGSTARIIQTGNETVIVGTGSNGENAYFYLTHDSSTSNSNSKKFLGPSGLSAIIMNEANGKQKIQFKDANGNIDIFTEDNIALSKSRDPTLNNNSNSNYDLNSYNGFTVNSEMNGAQGNSAAILPTVIKNNELRNKDISNKYNPNNINNSNYNYNSSLPSGIPASQIPAGQEDLYILKSQVVPPVCPKCPDPLVQCPNNFDATKCPPCPPCARCPEPAFDCKKVPNYNAFNPEYLPVPVLNDFTTFGM